NEALSFPRRAGSLQSPPSFSIVRTEKHHQASSYHARKTAEITSRTRRTLHPSRACTIGGWTPIVKQMGAVQLIQLFSIASTGGILPLIAARRIELGLFLLLTAFIAGNLLAYTPVAIVSGTNVYAGDVCVALVALAAGFRVFRLPAWTPLHVIWLA